LDNDFYFGSFLMTSTGLFSFSQAGLVRANQGSTLFTQPLSHPFNTYGGGTGINVNYPHSIIKIDNANANQKDYLGSATSPAEMLYFTDTDIGYFQSSSIASNSVYIDNWGSGNGTAGSYVWGAIHAPNGHSTLQSAIHRAVIWGLGVVFTNGTFVGVIDYSTQTSTTTYPTLNATAYQLPNGFQARDIRVEAGLIQIVCDNGAGNVSNPNRTLVITLDASNLFAVPNNTEPNDFLELDDNMALAETNVNGFPIIITKGRGLGNSIRKKDYWGWPQVQFLKTSSQGTRDIFPSLIDTSAGELLIGSNYSGKIYQYGSPFGTYSYRGTDNTGTFPDALTTPFFATGANLQCFVIGQGIVYCASGTNGTYYYEYFPITSYTSYNNPDAQFQTNFILLPNQSIVDWIRFSTMNLTGNEAFTPQYFTDFDPTPISLTDGDMTLANLDSQTNAKTYYGVGDLCYAIAIGGNWANSTTNNSTIPITKIEIGLSTAPK
jgi:hypothetical protein